MNYFIHKKGIKETTVTDEYVEYAYNENNIL